MNINSMNNHQFNPVNRGNRAGSQQNAAQNQSQGFQPSIFKAAPQLGQYLGQQAAQLGQGTSNTSQPQGLSIVPPKPEICYDGIKGGWCGTPNEPWKPNPPVKPEPPLFV